MTKLTISSLNPFRSCFKVGEHERHFSPSLTFHTVWQSEESFLLPPFTRFVVKANGECHSPLRPDFSFAPLRSLRLISFLFYLCTLRDLRVRSLRPFLRQITALAPETLCSGMERHFEVPFGRVVHHLL
jgi:hypothetical protein